jgi:hypothetical protein
VEVIDELPAGILPAAAAAPFWKMQGVPVGTPGTEIEGCVPSISGGGTLTCQEPCIPEGQEVKCLVGPSIPSGVIVEVGVPVDVTSNPQAVSLENHVSVTGGGAVPVDGSLATKLSNEVPQFSLLGLSGGTVTEAGTPATVAGSHPYSVTLGVNVPTYQTPSVASEDLLPVQPLRNLAFSMPQGVVVNPRATPVRCAEAQLITSLLEEGLLGCPAASQVGVVNITFARLGGETIVVSPNLYNMVPPPGVPAELGFEIEGTYVHVMGGLDGDFQLTANSRDILAKVPIAGVSAELWGDPSDPRHNLRRLGAGCIHCSVESVRSAFLTMPSACSDGLKLGASASSWQDPAIVTAVADLGGPTGEPMSVGGCESLQFAPTMEVNATSHSASSPTGLSVHLHMPQNEGVRGRATATLKKVAVQLPEGMTVNSSAAEGLGACSETQIGIGSSEPAACPSSSKVGTAEIVTPLLEQPLKGSIYLAEQSNNPFSTLLALYLVVEGEGIVVKLPGRVDADPSTGRLLATFDNNPQLPFSDLQVNFNSGPRATLSTPSKCDTYNVRSELTSWASPTPVVVNSPVKIDSGCSTGGFNPGLQAGTTNPTAGRYSPFVLRVTRNDGEQNLAGVSTTLPMGVAAKFAGVPLCPDAAAASGNCPAISQIGTTTTGVGVGTQPLFIPQPGKSPTAVYLAGPYRGGPYSLVIRVPAQAGPFDLGTISVRAAINVGLYTAQGTVVSDPLPQILQGIPVAYRDVRVNIDREFVLNPTSCDPKTIESRLVSNLGVVATPSARFQVGGCQSLGFKPELKLQLKGATKRAGHPALKAVVTYPKNGAYANIARAQVGLPPSEFLDQGNLNKVCTRPELQADSCPKTSVYGHAKAWTPLLDRPLEGPVYLGVGFGYKLPALVADLNGQVRILLKGKVDTTKQHGIRNTFEAVPDAPVSRFVLEMKGGKKYGLLENSENICQRPQRASALFSAQNGAVEHLQPKLSISCKGGAKGKKKH